MGMNPAPHSRSEGRFHERCRLRDRRHRLHWTNGRDMAPAARPPLLVGYGLKPYSAVRFDYPTVFVPCLPRRLNRLKFVDVPVEVRACGGRNWNAPELPATRLALVTIYRNASHVVRLRVRLQSGRRRRTYAGGNDGERSEYCGERR